MENNKNLRIPIALTIAGSDSSAGAGIQADIKSAAAAKGYMASVITALTAQNSVGVNSIEVVSKEMVHSQICAVFDDMRVEAIKTGMIPSEEIVKEVIWAVEYYNVKNLVVDPVIVSTSGATLIDSKAIRKIIDNLFPKALIVTPNIVECSYITGCKIADYQDFDKAAKKFEPLGAKFLLLKGGHMNSNKIIDILYDFEKGESYNFEFDKIDTKNTHGTGCSLSAAIATYLSLGYPIVESIETAENFLHKAIEKGKKYVYGAGYGPVLHLDLDK